MVLAAGASLASCSDRADWNTVQADATPSASQTLMENIASNGKLTQFKKLLELSGQADLLDASRYYTIWAPLDGTYNVDSVLSDTSKILAQFINNHIAEYNCLASGEMDERIKVLNGKSYKLVGNNDYTFGDVKMVDCNIPSSNGTIHITDGNIPFLANAYENIWAMDDVDSIADYFKKYELTYLDEKQSVIGPIVDGKQTYLDSVMVTYNRMASEINARLDNEDSVYTMILPNNNAYSKMYDAIASLYKYAETTQAQDVANATSSSFATLTTPSRDLAYLKDSLIRHQIVNNLVYSRTNPYNIQFFDGTPVGFKEDSVQSTLRRKFSNPNEIFSSNVVKENKKLSNGNAIVVDSLAFHPWETYFPEITVRGTSSVRHEGGTKKNYRLSEPDSSMVDLTNGQDLVFTEITPSSNSTKPSVWYYLPGVLSGTYRIYAVIPPATVDKTYAGDPVKPNWLNFTMNYYNGTKLVDYTFKNENFVPGSQIVSYNQKTGAEVLTAMTDADFFNDTTKVDTLFLGEFTFPRCYDGLGDYYPNVKVGMRKEFSTLASKGHSAAFDRTIRICSIILRPVEYDEYLKEEEKNQK